MRDKTNLGLGSVLEQSQLIVNLIRRIVIFNQRTSGLSKTRFCKNSIQLGLVQSAEMADRIVVDQKTQLSKALSWLLRHGAHGEKLPISSDGFLPVEVVLEHKRFKGKCSLMDIECIVKSDTKNRFDLRINSVNGKLEIRANQGHSMKELPDLELTPVTSVEQLPNAWVVHGTCHKAVPHIREQGLSRMTRVHIHFCPYEPSDQRVVSGVRSNVQVLVYVNVGKALADGIKFYKSANDVVLSEGNSSGIIEPKYFSKMVDLETGYDLLCH